MSDIGIVIVTHNSAEDIGACLDAALKTGAEVIVVDNASSDGTLDEIRRRPVRLIANSANRGFAAAVNQGIPQVRANYILLLNPDAVLLTGIDALRLACDRPGAAGSTGKLVYPDGAVQAGFHIRRLPTLATLAFEVLGINRLFPRNPVNWNYRCYGFPHDKPAKVEQPAGALLMFRRAVWAEVGGFDEDFYPVWFEDVDFCRRIRDKGYYVYYEPGVVASHRGSHSIRKILLEKRETYWYGNLLKYGFKHFGSGSPQLLCLAVIIGSISRMAMGMAVRKSLKPIGVYRQVVRMAFRYLLSRPDKPGSHFS
jgi:N-acetylglucosaminyl-diphospho-decaprenol L-rhamnosyltransferase